MLHNQSIPVSCSSLFLLSRFAHLNMLLKMNFLLSSHLQSFSLSSLTVRNHLLTFSESWKVLYCVTLKLHSSSKCPFIFKPSYCSLSPTYVWKRNITPYSFLNQTFSLSFSSDRGNDNWLIKYEKPGEGAKGDGQKVRLNQNILRVCLDKFSLCCMQLNGWNADRCSSWDTGYMAPCHSFTGRGTQGPT